MAIVVDSYPDIAIDNIAFSAPPVAGAVPFFAQRRQDRGQALDESIYRDHICCGAPMTRNFLSSPLTWTPTSNTKHLLVGVQRAGNNGYIVFQQGTTAANLERLDRVLELCLTLSFYLRFAVIPVRRAQAYVQSGDYQRAVTQLHLIYDDTVALEDQRKIYPALAAGPASFSQTVGPDGRLMRLRLAAIYLDWADWLFRHNDGDDRFEARRLLERVVSLHGGDCECSRRLGEIYQVIGQHLITGQAHLVDALRVAQSLRGPRAQLIDLNAIAIELRQGRSSVGSIEADVRRSVADVSRRIQRVATVDQLAYAGAATLAAAELHLLYSGLPDYCGACQFDLSAPGIWLGHQGWLATYASAFR